MTAITINNVSKRFGDVEILKSVDLDVKEQEFTVLLGPSGCGKSTLLRIIAGLETESGGSIHIGNREVTGLEPRDRNIAMVFQNYAVFPHMTVFDNIAFGLRMKKASDAKIKANVERTAELMHIEQYLNRYSGQLSGGQRQRVAVARALAVEPEVLLMDEPLSNLDALLRQKMRSELKAVLTESKTTTIYVTHDQVEAMSMADRIAVMNKGNIDQYACPDDIYTKPATEYVGSFIGSPPMNFINTSNLHAQAPAGAVQMGIRPEDFAISQQPQDNYWQVQIETREQLGSHQQLATRLDGNLCRVNVHRDLNVEPGQPLYLQPQSDKIRWYDAQGRIMA